MRVDLSGDVCCFERANDSLVQAERVLAFLGGEARARGVSEALLWRELLASASTHSIAGGALVPRTPDPASSRVLAAAASASTAEMAAAAEALRSLLRISICDDNDLQLARRVVTDSRHFFASLSVAATDRGVQPSELWRALELLGS